MPKDASTLLRVALASNLALSLVSGLVALSFGAGIAASVGALPAWLILGIGGGLIVFAAGIAWTLLRLRIGQALLISGLDLLWVAATLPLTLVPGLLTSTGTTLVVLLAFAVGGLGAAQLAGIRSMLKCGAEPGQYRHCIRVRSASEPATLWRVIRDLGAISRYSPGLSASRIEGARDVAVGAVRVCTDLHGRRWAEEIESVDDAGRSVTFRFMAEAEDFPFPVAALSGGWTVMPDASGGSVVDVWWIVTPRRGAFGWLLVALMTVPLDRSVPDIVAAMEADAMGEQAPRRHRRPGLAYC